MMLIRSKLITVSFIGLLMVGCNATPVPSPSLTSLYDEVHREGGRDTIKILREGLKERRVFGVTDPYIPIRNPDEVVPVWVPAHKDTSTGRLVHGHWENSVIRWSDWYTQ